MKLPVFLLVSMILLNNCGGGGETTPSINELDLSEQKEFISIQTLSGLPFSLPVPIDFSESTVSFELVVNGSELENNRVHIDLNEQEGVPSLVENNSDLTTLTAVIASQFIDAGLSNPPLQVVPIVRQNISDLSYYIELMILLPNSSQSIQIINATENASEIGLYDSLVSVVED